MSPASYSWRARLKLAQPEIIEVAGQEVSRGKLFFVVQALHQSVHLGPLFGDEIVGRQLENIIRDSGVVGALKLEYLLRFRQAIRTRKMQVHQVVHGAERFVLVHKLAAEFFGIRELVILRQGFKVR